MDLWPWKVAFVRRVSRFFEPGEDMYLDSSTILNRCVDARHGVEGKWKWGWVGAEIFPGFQASYPATPQWKQPQAASCHVCIDGAVQRAPCNERLFLPPVLHNLTTPSPLGLSESAVAGWVSWRGRCMRL